MASFLARATARTAARSSRFGFARSMGGYTQPPSTHGPGGKVGEVPDDMDQATGREREELKAFAQGREYFNRQPIQMSEWLSLRHRSGVELRALPLQRPRDARSTSSNDR